MASKESEVIVDYQREYETQKTRADLAEGERDTALAQLAEQKSYAGDLLLDKLARERDVERLTEERDALQKRLADRDSVVDTYADAHDALQERLEEWKTNAWCVYCGESVFKGSVNISEEDAARLFTEHVNACPKHPMAQARALMGGLVEACEEPIDYDKNDWVCRVCGLHNAHFGDSGGIGSQTPCPVGVARTYLGEPTPPTHLAPHLATEPPTLTVEEQMHADKLAAEIGEPTPPKGDGT